MTNEPRSKLWPLLFVVVGAGNIFSYYLKQPQHLHDLLQGVGFLLAAPWFYFEPISLRNPSRSIGNRPAQPMFKLVGMLGVVLVFVGLVFELARAA